MELTLTLDDQEWATLARHLAQAPDVAPQSAPAGEAARAVDDTAQALQLLAAGSLEGPQLLAQLEALCGSAAAAKRLMVRLRHDPAVRILREEGGQRFALATD